MMSIANRRILLFFLVVVFVVTVVLTVRTLVRSAHHHSVTLTWNPSPHDPGTAVLYNVYRSVGPGRRYEKIASGLQQPEYEDHNVGNGQTYYYAVTAVDASGRESRLSTEVRAKIP